MIAYKAFEKDLTCRGYKFDETSVNVTDKANCRQNGFHCAENPLDCLTYYPDWEESVYYKVLAAGDINEDGNDSKISCTELTLLEKLDVNMFISESLRYMYIHPLREWHSTVYKEQAELDEGFAIIRGKRPIAKGKIGVTFGYAQEDVESDQIIRINQISIDGKTFLPNVWYNIFGIPVDFESEGDL